MATNPTEANQPIRSAELDIHCGGAAGAPPLVFTHGWANDRTVWDPMIALLEPTHRCVSWSLRGHGESEITPPGTYSRDHALADFDAVLDAVERPAILVGHSLGGYLSLAQAIRRPGDVAALVLIGAGPGFRQDDARTRWNAGVAEQARSLGVPAGSEAISMHVDSWVIDELGTIGVPAMVVLGERDRAFAASAAVFEKYLDVRATVIVPGAGHNVHARQPEAVVEAMRGFLDALRSSGGGHRPSML